ncbi:MAG: cupredoxin domain-containing protein [Actinomycetota bacterium]
MARRTGTLISAALLLLVIAPAAPAAAGGGCHAGVTQGEGATVELAEACFTPTTLQIEPGGAVTFVNTDPMVHNVGGNLWGHFEDLDPGDAFTATFEQPGIYPYACTYHPGMTGAIVVGDGLGVGNGETVAVSSDPMSEPSPVVEVRTVTERASRAPITVGWLAGAAIGFALGLGAAVLVRRRARPTA